jgi:hypothetical protein
MLDGTVLEREGHQVNQSMHQQDCMKSKGRHRQLDPMKKIINNVAMDIEEGLRTRNVETSHQG